MFKNSSENTKQILYSFAPLFIIIILIFVVGNFGISKIGEIRDQIAAAEKSQKTLSQKLVLLRTVSETVGTGSFAASVALPDKNPSLAVISQVKSLASENSILVRTIKSGAEIEDQSGLSRVDIAFDVEGQRDQLFSFLKNIGNIAPLTVVDKVKLLESGGVQGASISVKSFWAPLPKELPTLKTQLSDLTADEKKLLSEVATLLQPAFSEITPQSGGGRDDPFTQ